MIIIKKYFWQILVVVLLIIIFLMNSCEQEINTKDNYIVVKEKTGYFEVKKPAPIKGVGYTFVTSKGNTIYFYGIYLPTGERIDITTNDEYCVYFEIHP